MSGGASALDLLQDVGSFGRPDKGVGVVTRDVFFNGLDQLRDAGEATASELFLGQVAKESLDHVEPGSTGRSEMKVEPFMLFHPGLHVGMFVRRVVVDNEMKLLAFGS